MTEEELIAFLKEQREEELKREDLEKVAGGDGDGETLEEEKTGKAMTDIAFSFIILLYCGEELIRSAVNDFPKTK